MTSHLREVTLLVDGSLVPVLHAHAAAHRMTVDNFLIACWRSCAARGTRTNALSDAPWNPTENPTPTEEEQ